jgi:hypothetical protein
LDAHGLFDILKAYTELIAGKHIPRLVLPSDHELPMSQVINNASNHEAPQLQNFLIPEGVQIMNPDNVKEVGIWAMAG